ncbi:unnamed protein product [Peniophora sp. CBMAI 1063]|nr:unnamed protein product [Peniophora sp. CBMAI 1063]
MASTGQPAATFKLDDAVATPSSEWAEATRAALEDKTAPVGTSHTTAAPGGTAPVIPNSSTLPAGSNLANTTPGAAPTGTGILASVQPPTPGPHIPGAYPSPHETVPESAIDTSAIRQDVNQLVQEARERLPAQEDLEKAAQDMAQTATTLAHTATSYLPQSIADKVAEYLPTARASENDAIHDKSMPTQETHGAQPGEKIGGAGALPGGVDEAAVAKLPGDDAATGLPEGAIPTLGVAAVAGVAGYKASEHDASHDKSLPTQETRGTQPNDQVGGVGALPGGASESGVAAVPENAAAGAYRSLPTQETQGAQPGEKVGGVGALPGGANETGVAKLPGDDAATGLPEGSKGAAVGAVVATSAALTATSTAAPNTASLPARPEDMVSKSHDWPDARSHGSPPKDAAATTDSMTTADKRDGSKKEILIPVAKGEGGQVPTANAAFNAPAKPEAAGKDTNADDQAQGASLDASHGKTKPTDAHSHSGASAHTEGSKDEAKHKASFMEKVKGEMKIISGKLGGDKHKVEEGKKLKSGEV